MRCWTLDTLSASGGFKTWSGPRFLVFAELSRHDPRNAPNPYAATPYENAHPWQATAKTEGAVAKGQATVYTPEEVESESGQKG